MRLKPRAMGLDHCLGFGVDDRADIGVRARRIAHPQFRDRALEHLDQRLFDVLLHQKQAQRRTALSRRLEGGCKDVARRLFQQCGRIDNHRVQAAGFGQKHGVRIAVAGHVAVNAGGSFGGTGEDHAADAGIASQDRADHGAITLHQNQCISRNARFMHQRYGTSGDEWGLFGRFGHDRIACGQRPGHLAGENCERKIPRRDGDDGAARRGIVRQVFRLKRIIVEEVDRLAQFGHRIKPALAGLANGKCHEFTPVGLEQGSSAAQDRRPFRTGHCGKCRSRSPCPIQSGARRGRIGIDADTDDVGAVGGIGDGNTFCRRRSVGEMRHDLGLESGMFRRFVEIEACRVCTIRENVLRQRNGRMRREAVGPRLFDRIGGNQFRRNALIHDLVDKGRVGTVLQKTADKIGQQVLVDPDRRIDAAAAVVRFLQRFMQRPAHAVQALEFEMGIVASHGFDRRDRQRIVGGKLRIDPVRHGEQFAGTGEIGDVGVFLARIDRIAVQPERLGELDFGIPIGTLDQAHRNLATMGFSSGMKPVKDGRCALRIGLNHDAESRPIGQLRIGEAMLDHVKREVEPVGFLGVDGQADIGLFGHEGEVRDARCKFAHHTVALHRLITRMQGGKLDGNAVVGMGLGIGRRLGDGADRRGIGLEITFGVFRRARCLAQHVEGMQQLARSNAGLLLPGVLQRIAD